VRVISVGFGEFVVSRTPGDTIKATALGSCVGVAFIDSSKQIVGLLHVALPDSSINIDKAKQNPGVFADTGIPAALKMMQRFGYDKTSRLIIKIAGGATIMDPNGRFNIGKRNILAVRKNLWKHRLGALAEDVGDTHSRTLSVDVSSLKVYLSTPLTNRREL